MRGKGYGKWEKSKICDEETDQNKRGKKWDADEGE
jgi:hypothetical protein